MRVPPEFVVQVGWVGVLGATVRQYWRYEMSSGVCCACIHEHTGEHKATNITKSTIFTLTDPCTPLHHI